MASSTQVDLRAISNHAAYAPVADIFATHLNSQMDGLQVVAHGQNTIGAFPFVPALPDRMVAGDASATEPSSPDALPTPIPKKALNAFVAFRCYYYRSPEFGSIPMKAISNPMAILWDQDPNKPLWTLLAKAWSMIRDGIGKERCPLGTFLKINCPAMNIPDPSEYFKIFGWKLEKDADGVVNVTRISSVPQVPLAMGETSMSVGDIIQYCHRSGFAMEYKLNEGATPLKTFHVQVKPGTRKIGNHADDAVYESRALTRNKRRAQRLAKRGQALPTNLKKTRGELKGYEQVLQTDPISYPAPRAPDDPLHVLFAPTEALAQINMEESFNAGLDFMGGDQILDPNQGFMGGNQVLDPSHIMGFMGGNQVLDPNQMGHMVGDDVLDPHMGLMGSDFHGFQQQDFFEATTFADMSAGDETEASLAAMYNDYMDGQEANGFRDGADEYVTLPPIKFAPF